MKLFLLFTSFVFWFGCGSIPKVLSPKKVSQKKNLSKQDLKVQPQKIKANPVLKDPKAFSVIDYDAEFVYIYSLGVRPPGKIVIVGDSEYYSTDFVERITQEIPGCSGKEEELWKYKIQKDKSGFPIRGRLALEGEITKFQTSDQIGLISKQSNDKNCLQKGNSELNIVNCDSKSSFLINNEVFISVEAKEHRNENGELTTDYHPSPEIDLLGILTINEKDYYYLSSKNEDEVETYIISKDRKHINPDKIDCPVKVVDPASDERIEP